VEIENLYRGSFIDWEAVAASWAKRTISSRMLLLGARRYLEEAGEAAHGAERERMIASATLPEEVKRAFVSPPALASPSSGRWGEFIDAALSAELEMVPYGERPPLLNELRAGLTEAAERAGERGDLHMSRWFLARRDALPGTDLPDDTEYLPV
jgi:hypothetical protein